MSASSLVSDFPSPALRNLRELVEEIARSVAAPRAADVDRDSIWPAHTMQALADGGLLGLHVPERLGGLGQGLLGLVAATELLGKACSSSSMCFGMHCVGTAVIAAKASPEQERRFLIPIAAGEHITTLALSESGSGVHFYLPQTQLLADGEGFILSGAKQFVTNAGHVHSYVASCQEESSEPLSGEFSCVVVESDAPGLSVQGEWRGLGMRGNASRPVSFDRVKLDNNQLLGGQGDHIWYFFEVVTPYFLTAMAGTYLGIAQAALDIAVEHVTSRSYESLGESLSDAPVIQYQLAEMWAQVEQVRQFVYRAARLGDAGNPSALTALLMSKVVAADAAVDVANNAMTLCGGRGYGENGKLARLLRDARAGHIMAPTTNLLKLWAGKSVLGMPLL